MAAQPVDRQAIADERVVDLRERLGLRLEARVERLKRAAAQVAVWVAHVGEQPVDRVRLRAVTGIELHLQRRGDAAEQRSARR